MIARAVGLSRRALKAARYSQPFNATSTSLVRRLLRMAGAEWPWAVKHLHRVGRVASALPNGRRLRLWSRADDWVSNQVFWKGWQGYEPETSPLFFQLATSARATLDVGAYVGFFSLLAGHANPRGRVVAFEPLPPVFARLQANVTRNGLANVTCVATAVGDQIGEASFYHIPQGLPCSSSLSLDFMQGTPDLICSRVPVTTVDQWVADAHLEAIDLVKIDTESTEPAVLRGMADVLRKWRPTIICEVLAGRGTEESLAQILRPLEYRFYHLCPDGPRLTTDIVGHAEFLNYAFVPASRSLGGFGTSRT